MATRIEEQPAGDQETPQDKRPKTWDTLFRNELDLARANYQRQLDSHKLIVDKAKVTFAVAGLIGLFGLNKLEDIFALVARSGAWRSALAIPLLVITLVSLSAAVIIALLVLRTREFAAISHSGQYVNDLHSESEDDMDRALASIYQRTADDNDEINKKLARKVNAGLFFAIAAFISTIVFIIIYGQAAWDSACH